MASHCATRLAAYFVGCLVDERLSRDADDGDRVAVKIQRIK